MENSLLKMSLEPLPINHSKSSFFEGGFDLFFFKKKIIEQVIIRCLLRGMQYTRSKEQDRHSSCLWRRLRSNLGWISESWIIPLLIRTRCDCTVTVLTASNDNFKEEIWNILSNGSISGITQTYYPEDKHWFFFMHTI